MAVKKGKKGSEKQVQKKGSFNVKEKKAKDVSSSAARGGDGGLVQDDRFARVHFDPRFKVLPKKKTKVVVDDRFKHMFTDSRFKVNEVVDKYGRKKKKEVNNELERFYRLDKDESKDEELEKEKESGQEEDEEDEEMKGKLSKEEKSEELSESVLPKKKTKVVVDDRFKHMFTDSRFKVNEVVDKYGRKKKKEVNNELERFYRLDKDESKDEELEKEKESGQEEDEEDEEMKGKLSKEEKSEELSESESESEEEMSREEMLASMARGEAGEESSDESDEEVFVDEEELFEEEEIAEEDIEMGDPTVRIAVQNVDWDNIKAEDLFVLLNSFKPSTGVLHSISIYTSEYGKSMLEQESKSGPATFFKEYEKSHPKKASDNETEYRQEVLRAYQKQRLRYYYAVAVFDCVDTAKAVYDQCDGVEFEKSSNKFDLRYVPDELSFDEDKPVSICTDMPEDYAPGDFYTAALQHTKAKLTWDEDDKERRKVVNRDFSREDLKELDFRTYLANSSDEESGYSEDDGLEGIIEEPAGVADKGSNEKAYASLLEEIKGQNSDDEDQEMEITFESGLSNVGKNLLKQKKNRDEEADMSVWDKYLHKKKELKKEKKRNKLQEQKSKNDGLYDEDSSRVDMNDPFFRDAFGDDFKKPEKSNSKKAVSNEEDLEHEKKRKAELELLMLDEAESKKVDHFNFKEVVEKQTNKKGKKGKKGKTEDAKDDFTVDVKDSRFSALYKSHHYAIDPTNPKFKKTEGMKSILKERQSQMYNKKYENPAEEPIASTTARVPSKRKNDFSSMVNAIKRNATNAKKQKH
eukprot:Nk52_evm46s230 gene=Nk52_evmTU46s230